MTFQLRDQVIGKNIEGYISAVALNDKDEIFYVVRDSQGRSHYREPSDLKAAS